LDALQGLVDSSLLSLSNSVDPVALRLRRKHRHLIIPPFRSEILSPHDQIRLPSSDSSVVQLASLITG
jgi:hypothetical protein